MLSESIAMPTVSVVNIYVHVNGPCSDINPKQSAAEKETNPSSVDSSHIVLKILTFQDRIINTFLK